MTSKSPEELADLLRRRNTIDEKIAALIHRPALTGHLGEWIAAAVFDIELAASAVAKGIDGHFRSGALGGRSVNVKTYAKAEGLLDVATHETPPDCYLVLAGPRAAAALSVGRTRPFVITSVFLFETTRLMAALQDRGVKIRAATSVILKLWRGAEVFPENRNQLLLLNAEQRWLLSLFSG